MLPPNAPHAMLFSRREPLGVVAAITPWNFPIAIPAWKIAPALVYGNTVVFKPASATPLTALRLVECLVDAGLPAGVLNLVTGSGSVVGGALAGDPVVRGLTFTGSHDTGSRIYARATEHFARVQLEMGGKNPTIVLDDADLGLAVRLAVMGGFALTGQSCTATSRVIVEEGIADRFAAALAEAANALNVGDGLDERRADGPGRERGAARDRPRLRAHRPRGGRGAPRRRRPGRRRRPLPAARPSSTAWTSHSRLAQEEIFGPVVGIVRARDLDDAIFKANAVGYGLAASVVTNDLRRAMTFVDRIEAGVVKVNEPTTGLALQAPFGGFKQSSANTFKEQGPAALDFYTRTKTVYVTYAERAPRVASPGYASRCCSRRERGVQYRHGRRTTETARARAVRHGAGARAAVPALQRALRRPRRRRGQHRPPRRRAAARPGAARGDGERRAGDRRRRRPTGSSRPAPASEPSRAPRLARHQVPRAQAFALPAQPGHWRCAAGTPPIYSADVRPG